MRFALILLIALLAPTGALPAATITLPMHGYYRVGRFMPVQILLSPNETRSAAEITIRGDAIVTTIVRPQRESVVVPVLVTAPLSRPLEWSSSAGTSGTIDGPFQLPGEDEYLIAYTSIAPEAAREILQGTLIPVDMRTEDISQAFDLVDVLFITMDEIRRTSSDQLGYLMGQGTIVCVPGDFPSDRRWPWFKNGSFWALRHVPAGPVSALSGGDASQAGFSALPTDLPESQRRMLLYIGILFAIVVVAVALLWPKRALVIVPVCVIVFAGGMYWWQSKQIRLRQGAGRIVVEASGLTQIDSWLYQATRTGTSVQAGGTSTRPILLGPPPSTLRLICGPDGRALRYECDLPKNGRIVFLTREITPNPQNHQPAEPITSPLLESARKLYSNPQTTLRGEVPATLDWWPTVVLTRPRK